MLPSVYIETSIVSYLVARPSRDPLMAGRQRRTREWWDDHRSGFELFTSDTTIAEVARGEMAMARERVAALAGVARLEMSPTVATLADALLTRGPLPFSAKLDAYHISFAAVYSVKYLLTWNLKHIANPRMSPRIGEICREHQCEPPVLCTPDTLL